MPIDFEDLLGQYTHKGYRVIACAAKYDPKLSWMKVQKMARADAECDLDFIGFIVFENKLKPETAGVITELNRAGIRNIMCTGDNILTAVSVARECGLINPDEPCFVPRFLDGWFVHSHLKCMLIRHCQVNITIQRLLSCGKVLKIRHTSLTKRHLWYDATILIR